METITIDKDITVFYITADSFPDGIMAAHEKLHALVPVSAGRRFYGVSRPENGVILYRAAAEEMTPGEAERLGCDKLVLKKGRYLSLTINNYKEHLPEIQRAFDQLLASPELDPEGYCVEWYFNEKDVQCMVRLRDQPAG